MSWTTPEFGCAWGWFLPGIRDWARADALGFSVSIGKASTSSVVRPSHWDCSPGEGRRMSAVGSCCGERKPGNRSRIQPSWAYSLAGVSLPGGREGWGLVGCFLPSGWFIGSAGRTGVWGVRLRWLVRWDGEIEFGPDRLAWRQAPGHSPAVGEGRYEGQAAAAFAAGGGGGRGCGSRSPRVSVTSIRRVSPTTYSRSWKLRPGTRPCVAALLAGSATMRVAGSNGAPQVRSCSVASRRARRAPRGVGSTAPRSRPGRSRPGRTGPGRIPGRGPCAASAWCG